MIKLTNFSKSYDFKTRSKKGEFNNSSSFSINNVNMTIPNGSITGLLGVNGSGKTTILKAICGIHFPTSGTITIDDLDSEEESSRVMEKIGYVPEIPSLPSNMKVLDFLHYAALLHGISKESLSKATEYVIKECSLEKLLDKKIKTLSKGQQQRVSFAQAIIHNPPNLILDEPISGLDPAQIIQIRELIKKLSKTKAILMSTHILQEVYSLCSSLYVMNNGEIVASGTEEEIVKRTQSKDLEDAFLKLSIKRNEE